MNCLCLCMIIIIIIVIISFFLCLSINLNNSNKNKFTKKIQCYNSEQISAVCGDSGTLCVNHTDRLKQEFICSKSHSGDNCQGNGIYTRSNYVYCN